MIDAESTIEKLLRTRKDAEQKVVENEAAYKEALNSIVSTPNGMFVFKTLLKALGVFAVVPSSDGVSMVADKALRDFYLSVIRPYLDTDLRRDMEN